MKKVLLATSALVVSAGFAAADVTLSGDAEAGIVSGNGGTDWMVWDHVGLDITMSGETDNGLTFGASLSIDSGIARDGFSFSDGWMGGVDIGIARAGSVFVSGDFGTVTFDSGGLMAGYMGGIDNLYDDGKGAHQLGYEYSNGGISAALTIDVAGVTGQDWSASVGYSMDALSASLATDSDGEFLVNLGYSANGISAGLEHDTATGDTELSLGYAANGFSVDATIDTTDAWSLGVGYAANGLSVAFSTDDADEWEATASYDLGGGLTANAGINFDDVVYLGLGMSF